MSGDLEVWLDCDLCPRQRLGTLSHDRGQVRFHYDKLWLAQQDIAFAIDPQLTLDAGPLFPKPAAGNFGIFLDSSPDRWGQTLMRRREALQAKDESRVARTLYSWDFLLGVQDATRQGALRFRVKDSDEFLAHEALAAPPVTGLAELASIAKELTRKDINDLDKLRRWLAVLIAPGASLGGARPKANFCDKDGSFWIAKFPAHDDDRDIGSWEGVASWLARRAGIDMPEAKVMHLSRSGYHTFCVRRFDRLNGRRRFYASAMTLLGKDTSEGTSYLELAEFLAKRGDPNHLQADLEQLFHRVAFNVAIGNRDDHLRNHGFILGPRGWRLAPAFDVNPDIGKAEHVLNLEDVDNRPSLETVLSTAAFYRLSPEHARKIVTKVANVVDDWEAAARRAGISRADIGLGASAFGAQAVFRQS
ncbi:MAG: HipA domain protein [Candidatus Handelsmanbacteria bacterium RIFCSPLOWO2_12_FULL_64_10]|uniref:HipA domain protein n=1 Tax=Handelsmanbacteria sp. (strain RIFCSPLOWO2_12_FULL_64_10) TaxID=1817868 RepID=A0A1F6CBV0_HANXR|nr:MAG: HipA domain protein [Candidatus Handelsmanbacteria bacterium RIFCSPLOWO2_12_FULL_64_10]